MPVLDGVLDEQQRSRPTIRFIDIKRVAGFAYLGGGFVFVFCSCVGDEVWYWIQDTDAGAFVTY